MSGARAIGVVIGAAPAAAVKEGLRAAVGLTLRGDRVAVAIAEDGLAQAGADGARATATLAMFEHPVRVLGRDASAAEAAEAALGADVVELWADAASTFAGTTLAAGPRARLHLVRAGRSVALAAERDAVRRLPAADDEGDDATYDALLDAVLAADVVLVW